MVEAAFAVLEQGPIVDLRGLTFPKLVDLLRHGTPVPIHGSQAMLFSVQVADAGQIAGQTIAEVFEQFPDLVAVAVIQGQQITLPRGMTRLNARDQLLIAASNIQSVASLRRLAGDTSPIESETSS
jgi:Trk K+ transport system NAD-binding subunit